jgi:hypothetical protein
MLGVDSEIATSALRLWVAAGSAALLMAFCALALFRQQSGLLTPALRAGFVIVSAALGATMTWAFLSRADLGSGAERRTFELRADALGAQARAPGSPLACLDALTGDSMEVACEKALFASPSSVAAASSYVAARLTLLSSASAFASRTGENIDDVVAPLRRSLEADRFGFVAHMLATRDGCTSTNCKALAVLHDATRVRADLDAQAFDRYLEHYATLWAAAADGAPADGAKLPAQANAAGAHKMVNIDFPSAASIPAISIMNPEPTGPVLPGVAAAAAANPNPQAAGGPPAHHAHKQAGNPSSLTQAASSGASATEPIWPEPVPPAPAPQAATAPAAGAPIELNPPTAARAQ